jgi:tetratricopeptide (TPR) repeat protein
MADGLEDQATCLAVPSAGSSAAMNALFDSAVQSLSAPAARAYRYLGLHPGPDFAAPAATALLGVSAPRAGQLLDELVESGLLGKDDEGRYRLHDLIKLHARTCAERDEPPEARVAVVERILTWYLAQAYRADWIAIGPRLRVGGPPFDTPDAANCADVVEAGPELRDDVEALDWLDRERGNLLAAQALAVDNGLDTLAWRMCEPLWVLFLSRKYYADWVGSQSVARDAAARSGEAVGEAQARKQLAAALLELGRLDEAEAELAAALDLAVRADHERLHASVLGAIGEFRLVRDELRGAMSAFEQSRAISLAVGDTRGVLLQDTMIGRVMLRESRHGEAYALLCRVLPAMAAFDEHNQARVRVCLARAAEALGRPEEAAALFEQAAALYRRRGEPSGEITALEGLADIAAAAGRPEEQRSYLKMIVERYEAVAAGERAEPYRRRLAQISC